MKKSTLFSNGGMLTFCDTFSCHNPAKWFLGSEEGPLNLLVNLCDECRQSIIDSLIEDDHDAVLNRVSELRKEETIEKEKEKFDGKEFPCKYCGEIFYSPNSLGAHVRKEHKGQEEVDKVSNKS